MSNKSWVIFFLIIVFFLLTSLGLTVVIIDPYFHYHPPLDNLEYPLNEPYQRYLNNGIARHFEYNAIITGTSMTENFLTSEFDTLFNVKSIKIPFAGASYKEINENLELAIEYNNNIQIVLRGLDYDSLSNPADIMNYPKDSYPTYLYDNQLFNDVNYILNKQILMKSYNILTYTYQGNKTPTFDEYSNWTNLVKFGKKSIILNYKRPNKNKKKKSITKYDYKNIYENLTKNVIGLADKNPEIQFYIFFTPYSIYYFDYLNNIGDLEKQFDIEKYAIEILIGHKNIHLYSFFDEYDMICDSSNYKDEVHYSGNVNSQILKWISDGQHELTLSNYKSYIKEIRDYYLNYAYDTLFE